MIFCGRSTFTHHVHRNEWESWANQQIGLHNFCGSINGWTTNTAITYYSGQLFRLRFKRRVVFFANTSDVRSRTQMVTSTHQIALNEFITVNHFVFNARFWHTPFGYFMTYLTQAGASVTTFLCVASIICFLIGACCVFIHFVRDIADDLSALNVSDASNINRNEVANSFCGIVQSYTDITGLS